MRQPAGAILGATAFLSAAAALPGLPDAALAGRWAALGLGLPLAYVFSAPGRFTAGHALAAALVAWAALTALWAPDDGAALARVAQIGWVGGFAFVLGSKVDTRWAWRGLALGVAAQVPLVAWQWLNEPTGVPPPNGGPSGLFFNRDVWAMTAMVALVGAASARDWWFAAGPAAGLMISPSRAALVALAVLAAGYAWRRSRLASAALMVVLAAGLALALARHDAGIADRIAIWLRTADDLTLLGHGAASYRVDFPFFDHAHNDALEVAYELGVVGIGIAVALARHVLAGDVDRQPRDVLLATLAAGAFSFPLELPATMFAAALAAGALCRDRHLVRAGDDRRRGDVLARGDGRRSARALVDADGDRGDLPA